MTVQDSRLREFIAETGRRFQRENLDSFWECEPDFRKLLDRGFLTDVVNEELRKLAADPHQVGTWLPNELILHRGGRLVLALSLLDEPKRYIHALPFHALYAPVAPGALAYERYRLPAAYRNELFDPALKLVPTGSGSVAAGDVLGLHSDQYAYDFKLPQPVLALRFMTTAWGTQEWLFSRGDLRAWQANDADLSYTQLRVAAYVLGRFAHQSSIEPLKLLAGHPHHAVRWSAIQNLGRLSRSEALVLIKQSANDPHPHVQRAARKTLEQLEKSLK